MTVTKIHNEKRRVPMDEVRVSGTQAVCEGCGRPIADGERAIMVPIGGGGFVLVCETCATTAKDSEGNPLLESEEASAIIVNWKGV